MPTFQRDSATIAYEAYGTGFPILLFAPGGMRSRMEMWPAAAAGPPRSWNDWTKVLADTYCVIAMDQRNAGKSRGPIAADHGWHTYAADHIGLMDHLGIRKFHTLGGCIGASFCLKLCELAPDRVTSAVLQNPIGFHPEHPGYFPDGFVEWSKEQNSVRSDLDAAAVQSFGRNMWGGDFVYSVSRDFARRCETPCLVLPGNDTPHPAVTGDELAKILPNVEHLQNWKGPEHLDIQRHTVTDFLAKHTPPVV
jgi:pimeloyl-ACP methyl ester carboxylesterase